MWFSLRSAMKRAKTAWNVHSNAPNNPSDLRCKTQSDYRGQLWQQKHTETMHNRANLGCKWLQDAKIATLNFRKSWHGWNFRPGWAGSAGAMLLCDCVYLFIYIYIYISTYIHMYIHIYIYGICCSFCYRESSGVSSKSCVFIVTNLPWFPSTPPSPPAKRTACGSLSVGQKSWP